MDNGRFGRNPIEWRSAAIGSHGPTSEPRNKSIAVATWPLRGIFGHRWSSPNGFIDEMNGGADGDWPSLHLSGDDTEFG